MRAREAFGFQLPLLELHCHWARTWEAGLNFWNVNIGPLSPPPCHWFALPVDQELGEVPLDGVDEEAGLGRLEKGKEGVGAGTVDLHLDISTTCRGGFDLLSMKMPHTWMNIWNTLNTFSMKYQDAPYFSLAQVSTSWAVPGSWPPNWQERRSQRFVKINPHSHPHHPHHIRLDQLQWLQGKISKGWP